MLSSYLRWTGRPLLVPTGNAEADIQSLWTAPFVVVSHGIQADPVLNYGNHSALKLWEMTWEEFVRTPSRLTAEPPNREERAALLDSVARQGFITGYRGIRISKTGRRFRIEDGIVWNLIAENGEHGGQAATFSKWTYLL